ncbi:MAG: hypothetical protein ACREE6_15470, partial [Limisphaerales bacterium]
MQDELLQTVFLRVHEAVEFGLRPVQWIGFVIPASLHGFDFLQQYLFGRDQQAVNPAPDLQREFLHFQPVFNG